MGNKTGRCLECFDPADFIIAIKTGDTKGAGLHNSANIVLVNEAGVESRQIRLSGCCLTVFKKGRTDKFKVKNLAGFGKVNRIKIEQQQNKVEWYIDKIAVVQVFDNSISKETVFPVSRWLRHGKELIIDEFDTHLPQNDPNEEQRRSEVERNKLIYSYKHNNELPPQMNRLPRDEIFSNFYKWDILRKRADLFRIYEVTVLEKDDSWCNFQEIVGLFTERNKKFRLPAILQKDLELWKSDVHFGRQRLKGCNPRSIQLCREIPENFGVCADAVKELLEESTLVEALKNDRIFMVNHSILDDILDEEGNQITPSPMALFYLNEAGDLMPISIQLYQQKVDPDGKETPVFTPNDPHFTWLLAKMWFNNADAAYQRMILIASSHWVLECITISMHRNLSPSHPIHRLLQTYLRLVLPINHFEMYALLNGQSNSWIDQNTTIKNEGMMKLIERYWKDFDFTNDMMEVDMDKRQVLNGEIIGTYPYRDDAFNLKQNIYEYVTHIVNGYYEDEMSLVKDIEIQNWAAELADPEACQLKNIPGNGEFTSCEHLIQFLSHVIFKVTVEHASLILPLYDECAFVPNYPLSLRGKPPNSKDSLTEADVMETLPSKNTTMEILIINKLLSERDSSGLADSRAQFQFDPVSLPARERFGGQLRETAAVIDIRNSRRGGLSYDYLNPKASSRTAGYD